MTTFTTHYQKSTTNIPLIEDIDVYIYVYIDIDLEIEKEKKTLEKKIEYFGPL